MTKQRYCDFCKVEIKQGQTYIRLTKIESKIRKEKSKTGSDKVFSYQTYPQKNVGDMCLSCQNKLKEKIK